LASTQVIVPPNAGVGSAVGFLAAPISYELIKSRHMRLDGPFDFTRCVRAARRNVEGRARAGRAGCARCADLSAAASP